MKTNNDLDLTKGSALMSLTEIYGDAIKNLPSCNLYSQFLNIASIRFNLKMDECRNRFGLYSIEDWGKLFDTNVE